MPGFGREGQRGRYADVGRPRGRPEGGGARQHEVRDFLRSGPKNTTEIARHIVESRDGPHVVFEGTVRRNAERQARNLLHNLRMMGEVTNERGVDPSDRRISLWSLRAPRPDPPSSDRTRRPIRQPEIHEGPRPVSREEQQRRRDERRRRSDPSGPEFWGEKKTGRAARRRQTVAGLVHHQADEQQESEEQQPPAPTWEDRWLAARAERQAEAARRSGQEPEDVAGLLGGGGREGLLGKSKSPPPDDDDGGDDNGGKGQGFLKGW